VNPRRTGGVQLGVDEQEREVFIGASPRDGQFFAAAHRLGAGNGKSAQKMPYADWALLRRERVRIGQGILKA
jgi:hypothetical protein